MFHSSESEVSSFMNSRLIEQALKSLKQTIALHHEREQRLERLYSGWQQQWLSKYEQLRMQIETLEARLAPWMMDRTDGPRLAVVSHHEDAA